MVEGRDSSIFRPNLQQARAARAAGVRIWWGYLGSRDGLGLLTRWSKEDFAAIQQAGLVAGAFCSGWDDPEWIRATSAAWGLLTGVDAEPHIRDDGEGGDWIPGFVQRAQCGLYGRPSVHFHTGQPDGRGALFNVVADYLPGGCTGETWPGWLPRPPRCGWQCRGTYDEFGGSVDRGLYDDWFLGGADVAIDPKEIDHIRDSVDAQWDFAVFGTHGDQRGLIATVNEKVDQLLAAVKTPLAVDENALAEHLAELLADHLPAGQDPAVTARAVAAELAQRLAS